MTRRVNLLHKVSTSVSPPLIPQQTRIYSCLKAIICFTGGRGATVGVGSYITVRGE